MAQSQSAYSKKQSWAYFGDGLSLYGSLVSTVNTCEPLWARLLLMWAQCMHYHYSCAVHSFHRYSLWKLSLVQIGTISPLSTPFRGYFLCDSNSLQSMQSESHRHRRLTIAPCKCGSHARRLPLLATATTALLQEKLLFFFFGIFCCSVVSSRKLQNTVIVWV